jgi:hypothetical protein
MQDDIRLQYQQALDESHHGYPTIVETVQSGTRGRPSIHIDPEFLRWAYSLRSTSSISRFLGVGRRTVRNALISHGIATPQASPFIHYEAENNSQEESSSQSGSLPQHDGNGGDSEDDILNHTFTVPETLPTDISTPSFPVSYTSPLSDISDSHLDNLISQLRQHYTRAGITMLDGMVRRLGYRIPRERIRQSLLRIDPVQRVFERIRIRRRVYSVPGPNSLWHHDGQHGAFYSQRVVHYSEIVVIQDLFAGESSFTDLLMVIHALLQDYVLVTTTVEKQYSRFFSLQHLYMAYHHVCVVIMEWKTSW